MELDEKEAMRMVIHAIEADSISRAVDIVGRLIDLFNSKESRNFLENKRQQARDSLVRVENAMRVSLYEGMQAMRQLVTDIHVHPWTENSALSRFQYSGQNIYYLLTRASIILISDSLNNNDKVREIWNGITKSLALDEDRNKAGESLGMLLSEWRHAECENQNIQRQRSGLQAQAKASMFLSCTHPLHLDKDFKRLVQAHSDTEVPRHQLHEHFKLEELRLYIHVMKGQ